MAATSPKKKETKPAVKKPEPKKKAAVKKPVKKVEEKSVAEEVMEQVHEHEEHCECCSGDDSADKNGPRSYVLRDVWYESLNEVIDKEDLKEENKREMLFLTLSNAMLDLVMDIIPADYAKVVADNIDDFLAVTIVNKENNIDLLAKFKEDFVKEKGDTFEDEEQLQAALGEFEDKWWNSKRKDLKGKVSPNEALEEAAKRYGID